MPQRWRATTRSLPRTRPEVFSLAAAPLTRPNGVSTSYNYDSVSRLLSVLHQSGGVTIDGAGYGLDAAGNRTSKQNLLNGVTENYTYDLIYQLTQVVQGANTAESYSYDAVGNRLSSLGLGPYQYNNSNRLTSTPDAAFTYDNNGNTLTKADSNGVTGYTWDYENRLTSVTLPGTGGMVTFKYDPFGRRIEKVSSTGTTIFVYDGANVVDEVNAAGAVTAQYAQGVGVDEPLAAVLNGTLAFYHADGLGSVTSLTNSSGSAVAAYTRDSFGKVVSTADPLGNRYRYTAREWDEETGLYYYRARYYDPQNGRFISEDPMQFKAGVNFYAYVLNNPIDNSDALGLEPEKGCKDCKGNPIQGLGVAKQCCSGESPTSNSAPNPYMPWEGYAGVNAGMMFQYGGNGPWGQLVRSCLLCMYRHGATANEAHWFCYFNSANRTSRGQALEGFGRAVVGAVAIEAGQVVVAIDSKGTDIRATGPWFQLVGGAK